MNAESELDIDALVAAAIVQKMRDGSKPAQELVRVALATAPESRTDFQRALYRAERARISQLVRTVAAQLRK